MAASCCGGAHRSGNSPKTPVAEPAVFDGARSTFATALIPAGDALVGTRYPVISGDGEHPIRKVRVGPFRTMIGCVTNAMFREFVDATRYVTDAERFGWSFVFHSQVAADIGPTRAVEAARWWRKVDGACWKRVDGSVREPLAEHPVVHVSWNDASQFAIWAGGRLPTEAEWEHGARGGLGDSPFPWGDREPDDHSFQPCNIWQGDFPHTNTVRDGYATTAPAISFEPNDYGLYNTCGNVWEWTAEPFRIRSVATSARKRMKQSPGLKLLKGGSFLCHRSYCYRYRIAARTGNSPDSSASHQGFRVIFDR